MPSGLPSWGLNPQSNAKTNYISPKNLELNVVNGDSCLPYGLGRSYGDSCLNNDNTLCPTTFMDMLVDFDKSKGILRAQAGASLKDILNVIVPNGYFIPISPGTKNITLGGAIANDIHGKNHHTSGCFGNHVENIVLKRTSGEVLTLNQRENKDLLSATIGGLGLTGLITEATIKLKAIKSSHILANHTPFRSLDEFFEINHDKEPKHEYTVAWIDTLSPDGRGIYMAGDHATPTEDQKMKMEGDNLAYQCPNNPLLTIPIFAPNILLNPLSIKIFNELYFNLQKNKKGTFKTSINSFFFPLDGVGNWNKLYGRRGFFQYQCVIPNTNEESKKTCLKMLETIALSKQGSFLAVLKTFGSIEPRGLLSFPKKGITIALDFPNNGSKTKELFDKLDKLVVDSGGRLYPAKDAHMNKENFKRFYPNWEKLEELRDPKISSSFWKRVTNG